VTTSFRRGKQGLPREARRPRLDWDEVRESLAADEALAALDVDVARESRGEMWAFCPLPDHPGADRSGSNFSIHEGSLVWKCFTCDEGGAFPELVIKLRGLEDGPEGSAWQQALRFLAEYSDVALDGTVDEVYNKQVERAAKAADSWGARRQRDRRQMPAFAPGVLDRMGGPAPLSVLAKWHVDDEEVVEAYGVRYSAESEHHGYVAPAITIPHFFGGRLVGYQRRWLADDRPDWVPKYTNTEDFPKADTLYGWDVALPFARAGHTTAVVESAMTVLRLACLGIPAVGTFGASVTDEQIRLLGTLRPGLALAYDNDRPGRKATRRIADELSYLPLDVVPPPRGAKADLADADEAGVRDAFARAYPAYDSDRIKGE